MDLGGGTHEIIPAVFSVGSSPYSRHVHPPRLPPPTKTFRWSLNSGVLGLSYLVINVIAAFIDLGKQ
jgi:hypothetical protein